MGKLRRIDWRREWRTGTQVLEDECEAAGSRTALALELGLSESYFRMLLGGGGNISGDVARIIFASRIGLPVAASLYRHEPVKDVLKAQAVTER